MRDGSCADAYGEIDAGGWEAGRDRACLMTSACLSYEDCALCGSGTYCIIALMYGCGGTRSNVAVLAMPVVKLS